MNRQCKTVCFGEALIDMLAQPPAATGAPRAFLQYAGGAPANVSAAVARLGGNSHFVGMLAQDMFGDFLLQSLQDVGVLTDGIVRTDEARTALAFVALDPQGERSFSFYRPPSADMLFRSKHFDRLDFSEVGVFHVCSNSMTEDEIAKTTFEGMRRASAASTLVSFDLNLRPMLWPPTTDPAPRLWEALLLADLVKLSREEFDWLSAKPGSSGGTVITHLWRGRAQLLVITDGDRPSRWYTRQQEGEVAAFKIDVQDTTAAGDAFVGGLLFQLVQRGVGLSGFSEFCLDRRALEESLRFASAVGALAVTRKGAFAAMPALAEVLCLINEQRDREEELAMECVRRSS